MAEIYVGLPEDLAELRLQILASLNQSLPDYTFCCGGDIRGKDIELLTDAGIVLTDKSLRQVANTVIDLLADRRSIGVAFESPKGVKYYEQ